MKKIPWLIVICCIALACSKSNDTLNIRPSRTSLASKFVGNWKVQELVNQWIVDLSNYTSYQKLRAIDTFYAPIIQLSDSSFATIQTQRLPQPPWVSCSCYANFPGLQADSLSYIPVDSARRLRSANGASNGGVYSLNLDTLSISYSYGGDGTFLVYQTWIRQK